MKKVLCLLVMGLLVACVEMTPLQKMYAVDEEFTSTVEKYNQYYKAADEETQNRWNTVIDPLILSTNAAFVVYKEAVLNGTEYAAAEEEFLALQKLLIAKLGEEVYR